ncbi:MAG: YCF48-related protein [Candidatus Poribacteria bacterium]|nr:YCF48-related protein [Candidatus Poribacteria bacterium]
MKYAPLGWAVGHAGIVQRTVNGGQYWKHHETDTGYDLFAVSFITKRKGWAVGHYGIILRTTDGGFTWEVSSNCVTQNLHSILALSED